MLSTDKSLGSILSNARERGDEEGEGKGEREGRQRNRERKKEEKERTALFAAWEKILVENERRT